MPPVSGFVQRVGTQLLLTGRPYPIVGGNTYYLAYVEESTMNGVLDLAASFGMNVLRTWAFLDSEKAPGPGEVCFQAWDGDAQAPRWQDGENGLVRLDRAIASAGERGLRLILTLTNNWKDFGGMPRYVQWYGMEGKKERFYTDERCRSAYQNWVRQLVSRRNTVNGRLYSDEPAILAWELANEPRGEGWGGTKALTKWVEEMSGWVRSLDANHLICAGDEGYFHGDNGVDCEQLLAIEAIDFGTFHMYADSMAGKQDPREFGLDWIRRHIEAGQQAGKPMLLEEYGLKSKEARNEIYAAWLRLIEDLGSVGDLVWMIGLPKSGSQPYDPDAYVVSDASAMPAIAEHARRMLGSAASAADDH